jgi:hypothetical protein
MTLAVGHAEALSRLRSRFASGRWRLEKKALGLAQSVSLATPPGWQHEIA